MICFICKTNIEELSSLVVHFKIIHNLSAYSTYECCENSCSQYFSSLSKFKRHLISKHIEINKLDNNCLSNFPSNIQTISSANNIPIQAVTDLDNEKNETKQNNIPDLNKFFNNLYKSIIQFVMNLHSNNNFTFKDIIQIQTQLQEMIFQPLSEIYKITVQNEIKEPLIKAKFFKINDILSDPFKHCNSEHKLTIWLKQNNYTENLLQFTINNEISIIQSNGISTYGEEHTKGVLLPLRFQFKRYLEHGNNFNNMYEKLNTLSIDSNNISNFVQGELWKKKLHCTKEKSYFHFFFTLMT